MARHRMASPTLPAVSTDAVADATLDEIGRGGRVRVIGVEGDDPIARRLGELGLRAGVEIEVLQRAPLGDPTLFELCGYQLCLRRTESRRIRVARVGAEAVTSRGDARA